MSKRAKSDAGTPGDDSGQPLSTLGPYLRQLRHERRLSLREAAERTGESGISRSYLNQVETGKIKRPRPDTLTALATAYDADYVELLRQAGYELPHPDLPASLAWLPPGAKRLDRDGQRLISELVTFLERRNQRSGGAPDVDVAPDGADWIAWQDVHEWAHTLKGVLRRASFDPDVVIGLGRGGAILGGMIAGALHLKPVRVLDMKHEPGKGPEDRSIEGKLHLDDLDGVETALLVQGEVRTGKSLRAALGKVSKKLTVRTAALVVRPAVPKENYPDDYLHVGNLDPPWRRLPGYAVGLRSDDDD